MSLKRSRDDTPTNLNADDTNTTLTSTSQPNIISPPLTEQTKVRKVEDDATSIEMQPESYLQNSSPPLSTSNTFENRSTTSMTEPQPIQNPIGNTQGSPSGSAFILPPPTKYVRKKSIWSTSIRISSDLLYLLIHWWYNLSQYVVYTLFPKLTLLDMISLFLTSQYATSIAHRAIICRNSSLVNIPTTNHHKYELSTCNIFISQSTNQ